MATLNKHLFLSHARITWVYVGYKVPARAGMLAFFLFSSVRTQQRPLPTRGRRAHKLSQVYVRTQGLWLRRVRFSSGAGHAVRLDSFFFSIYWWCG